MAVSVKNFINIASSFLSSKLQSRYVHPFMEKCIYDDLGNQKMLARSGFSSEEANLLLSFPRSGNGWVRIVLGVFYSITIDKHLDVENLPLLKTYSLAAKTGIKTSVFGLIGETEIPLDFYIPDLYQYQNLKEKMNDFCQGSIVDVKTLPIYKTHHLCSPKSHCHSIGIILREPKASVLSASLLLESELLTKSDKEVNAVVQYFLRAYVYYLENYLLMSKNSQVYFIFHDDVVNNLADWIDNSLPTGRQNTRVVLSQIVSKFPLRSGFNKEILERVDIVAFPDYSKATALFQKIKSLGSICH